MIPYNDTSLQSRSSISGMGERRLFINTKCQLLENIELNVAFSLRSSSIKTNYTRATFEGVLKKIGGYF